MSRKGKSAVEGDLKKGWSGIETEAGVEKEQVVLEVSLMAIHREKRGRTFARIERKTPVLRSALQSKQYSLCGLHCSKDRGDEGQTARSSA